MNIERIRQLRHRFEEAQQRLQMPETWSDPETFTKLQKEVQELTPFAEACAALENVDAELRGAEEILGRKKLDEVALKVIRQYRKKYSFCIF